MHGGGDGGSVHPGVGDEVEQVAGVVVDEVEDVDGFAVAESGVGDIGLPAFVWQGCFEAS